MRKLTCPVCQSHDLSMFIEINGIPIYCNLLYPSRNDAKTTRRADIQLGFCKKCAHVYNYAFDPNLMDYTQDYENSLHFSPQFQKYAEKLATHLIERYHLYGKSIIDIGCGDGDFLELLCASGSNHGYGFDPSHVPDLDSSGADKGITFIRDYYSGKYAEYPADFVCCRHVLEHIQDPRDFLKMVRDAVKNSKNSIVFFEVPNVLYTLKDLGIWDLIYEHCSYFSPSSLKALFEKSGFRTLDQSETFQGQFLTIETTLNEKRNAGLNESVLPPKGLQKFVNEFKHNFDDKVSKWKHWLQEGQKETRKIVVWGAGSKGATFLNLTDVGSAVEFVVDINPRKHGNYIAGSAQEIVAPDHLRHYQPDSVIVMNPVYMSEIEKKVHDLGINPQLLTV